MEKDNVAATHMNHTEYNPEKKFATLFILPVVECMVGSHGSACQCQHDLAEPAPGLQWLHEYIDKENISSLNEENVNASKNLFRPYSDRLTDPLLPCRLSQEEEPEFTEEGLVIHVPFVCPVKLTGISVIGGDAGASPNRLQLFANLHDCGSEIDVSEPSQTIECLVEDFCGVVEYPLRPVRFSQVNSVTLQFPHKEDGGPIEVNWIGLKGIASGDQRKAVLTAYESRANVADHEVKENPFSVSRQIQ